MSVNQKKTPGASIKKPLHWKFIYFDVPVFILKNHDFLTSIFYEDEKSLSCTLDHDKFNIYDFDSISSFPRFAL